MEGEALELFVCEMVSGEAEQPKADTAATRQLRITMCLRAVSMRMIYSNAISS